MSWEPDEETLAEIRAFSLQNALEYEGKANPGSVIGRIMGARQDAQTSRLTGITSNCQSGS